MRQHLISIFWAVTLMGVYFAVLAAVNDPIQTDLDPVAACLPEDLGEKSTLWLESDHQGGLELHCEKHAALGFSMAQIPVPVSND